MEKERTNRFATVAEMLAAAEMAFSDGGQPRPVQAVGLFVETKPKNDDKALIAADEIMAAAEQLVQLLGLRINVESADSLLAIGVDLDPQEVLDLARSLREQFLATPDIELHIAVHSSSAEAVGDEIRTGDILSVSTWPSTSVVE